MLDSLKMRLMCGLMAVTVAFGSLASPVMVWADDDDDFLDDLIDLDDSEIEALSKIMDHDGDDDVDEYDVDAIATIAMIGALAEADAQYEAEMAAKKAAEAAAEAQRLAALDAQKRAEQERLAALSKKVDGIWISTSDVTLTPGQTYQVTAGVRPDTAKNKGIRFSTSDGNIATIDGSGIIRANKVGSCYVTATSDDGGYQARAYVRVNPAPAVAQQTIADDSAWLQAAATLVLAAGPKATVNLAAPKAMSFDTGLIQALMLRPDVTLAIAYPFNGHTYLLTVPAGYPLASRMDKTGKVSFLNLSAVKDGKVKTTMIQ